MQPLIKFEKEQKVRKAQQICKYTNGKQKVNRKV